jgi:acyl-CoA reductase-like NAD-dependent aldehyde dehydrogenase
MTEIWRGDRMLIDGQLVAAREDGAYDNINAATEKAIGHAADGMAACDHTVAQEEIFGPVLVAIPHDGDDHAVEIANNSRCGLSGSVLSASDDRARSAANRIRTGTANVNGGVFYDEEYLEIKSIAQRAA